MDRYLRFFLVPVAAFLIVFLFVGFNNRYATDDFEFLLRFRELGFTDSILYFYNHWNTRWAAIGLINLVIVIEKISGTLFWYHVISIGFLWFACFRITGSLVPGSTIPKKIIISGTMTASFFFCCFSIPDVFYWVNSSAMYLFGCIAFLLVLGEIMSKNRNVFGYILVSLCGFLLGGMYEPLVMNAMILSVLFIVFIFYTKGGSIVSKPYVLKTIIFLSVLMIGFAISYAGEGHIIRSTFLPKTTLNYKAIVLCKSIVKMFVFYLPVKFLISFALALPWFIISSFKPVFSITNRVWFLSLIIFILFIVSSLAPVVFIMSEMGPERAWTQIAIYITAFSIITAIWTGRKWGKKIMRTWIPSIIVTSITVYIVASGSIAARKSFIYSSAYDERMLLLKNNKLCTDTLYLIPLPESGWLTSAELNYNSDHHTNKQLKNYLKIDCEIARK